MLTFPFKVIVTAAGVCGAAVVGYEVYENKNVILQKFKSTLGKTFVQKVIIPVFKDEIDEINRRKVPETVKIINKQR